MVPAADGKTVADYGALARAARAIATQFDLTDIPGLVNVLSMIQRDYYRLSYNDTDDAGGWSNRDAALRAAIDEMRAGAVKVYALSESHCHIMAAVKLKSATSVYPWLEAVGTITHTYRRKERVAPRTALLRGLLFPVMHYVSREYFLFSHPVELCAATLEAAGWDFEQHEIEDALEDVVRARYALWTAEEDEIPFDDDPEIEEGDEPDIENDWLAHGEYLERGLPKPQSS
jgi:hypothetical protein